MKILGTHIGTATTVFGIVIASGMTLALAAPVAAGPILINGSFEYPDQEGSRFQVGAGTLSGWTYAAGPTLGGYDLEITYDANFGIPAADGHQYLDFGANSTFGASISQTFTTNPGDIYTVVYSTGEQQGDNAAQIMRAIVANGSQTITADNTKLAIGFSAGKPITFTALGNLATLTFLDATPDYNGSAGSNVILDAVSVTSQAGVVGGVPEPASWALMMAGFGIVGTTVRSRRATGTVVTG